MKISLAQNIADALNALGYSVDVPNEKGEMKFGPECHEVQTILSHVLPNRELAEEIYHIRNHLSNVADEISATARQHKDLDLIKMKLWDLYTKVYNAPRT